MWIITDSVMGIYYVDVITCEYQITKCKTIMGMKILLFVLMALVSIVIVGGGLCLTLVDDAMTNVCGILLIVLWVCILLALPAIIEKHFNKN